MSSPLVLMPVVDAVPLIEDVKFGYHANNQVVLRGRKISSCHATISMETVDGDALAILKIHSKHGMLVNNAPTTGMPGSWEFQYQMYMLNLFQIFSLQWD